MTYCCKQKNIAHCDKQGSLSFAVLTIYGETPTSDSSKRVHIYVCPSYVILFELLNANLFPASGMDDSSSPELNLCISGASWNQCSWIQIN